MAATRCHLSSFTVNKPESTRPKLLQVEVEKPREGLVFSARVPGRSPLISKAEPNARHSLLPESSSQLHRLLRLSPPLLRSSSGRSLSRPSVLWIRRVWKSTGLYACSLFCRCTIERTPRALSPPLLRQAQPRFELVSPPSETVPSQHLLWSCVPGTSLLKPESAPQTASSRIRATSPGNPRPRKKGDPCLITRRSPTPYDCSSSLRKEGDRSTSALRPSERKESVSSRKKRIRRRHWFPSWTRTHVLAASLTPPLSVETPPSLEFPLASRRRAPHVKEL